MNIQRLKHAYARGARIIKTNLNGRVIYEYTAGDDSPGPMWAVAHGFRLSLNPFDEHLEYGPVSTALRDMALFTNEGELDEFTEMFMDQAGSNWFLGPGSWTDTSQKRYNLQCDFCRLFMAELLADEGL